MSARARPFGAVVFVALASVAPVAPAVQGPQGTRAAQAVPSAEGSLDNDVFVPIAEGAVAACANGDQALLRARALPAAAPRGEGERLLDTAFDRWREALTSGGIRASAWFDSTSEAERRLAEGVHAAVARRLLALSSSERARWTARLAPVAEKVLGELHDGPYAARATRLAEGLGLFPFTPAAARSALELGDQALEAGQRERARGWYARARFEAEQAGDEALVKALDPRFAALSSGHSTRAPEVELWQRATAVDFAGSFAWTDPGRRATSAAALGERWLRPGAAFLAGSRCALQTASEVLVLALASTGALELSARLRMADFLGGYTPELAFDAPRVPPGWPLLPLVDDERLIVVVGRARAEEANVLLALRLEPPRPHQALGLELARAGPGASLDWAIIGAERLTEQGSEPVPELEELGDYEFQPGPVLSAERIVVQARQFEGRVRAWLLAFERGDGALAWKFQLASGADRVATPRFAQTERRVSAQPLLALGVEDEPRVFAGTHLGLGVLVDSLTGEPLWSFKNRRRGEHEQGWSGDRPVLGALEGGAGVILWAPMDSDRLYTLVPGPLRVSLGEAGAVLAHPPAPLVDAQTFLGGDAEEHLVLGSTGRERTLSARRAGRDRVDALDLFLDERFRGLGLVSPERAWASTNRGLYLFDRTRELYLLDCGALPPAGGEAPGGDLYARDAHVIVVGASAVWSFLAR